MKAVIFDYGNVLCRPQQPADIVAMAAILNLSRELFERIYWRYRLEYDEAKLSPVDYWSQFGRVTAAEIEQLNRLDGISWTHPSAVMPAWARQLQAAGFRIGLLSNMPFTIRDAVLACDWLPEFDHRTFSCELGISKPSAEIYFQCLTGLGVEPGDALFLDDRPPNVRGAEQVGMHGIVYTTAEDLAAELEQRFDIPAPGVVTVERVDEEDR
jgi:putative hydrolase of the HAD superfamily